MGSVQRRDEHIIKLVGRNIKKYRDKKGLTQQELADMIDLDKNLYGQVSKMERGVVNTTISMLAILARALEIEIIDLLKEDNP